MADTDDREVYEGGEQMKEVWVIVRYSDWAVSDAMFKPDKKQTTSIFEGSLCAVGETEKAVRDSYFPTLGDSETRATIKAEASTMHNYDGDTATLVTVEWITGLEYYLIRKQPIVESIDTDNPSSAS